jgi:energy-converting hydrogenase Eha subunit E
MKAVLFTGVIFLILGGLAFDGGVVKTTGTILMVLGAFTILAAPVIKDSLKD